MTNEKPIEPLDFDSSAESGEAFPIRVAKVEPCGVVDEVARVLEPVHYDCEDCAAIIRVRLWARQKTAEIGKPKIKKRRPTQDKLTMEENREKISRVVPDSFGIDELPEP